MKQYGRIRDIDLKMPARPPAFAFVAFMDARGKHAATQTLLQFSPLSTDVKSYGLNADILHALDFSLFSAAIDMQRHTNNRILRIT